ncbi:MAG: 4-hydroxythreonine-4-phosphate dehydrogenase PdxA [Paludibacteraceae bacterium]|nr:4-hydroxythreonine-4-phosphate dehydrogenase PdxA [Paludibacteraceae bacterium]
MKPIIAITAGDINGVGYEVIVKSLADPHIFEICKPVVYGNLSILKQHMHMLPEEYRNLQFQLVLSPKDARDGKLSLVSCYPDNVPLAFGESTKEAGKASFAALERACNDLKAGLVDALVTAPINKENIQSEQFTFSGHTEYLASVFGDEHKDALMMMVSEQMKVALVCNHTPITKVAQMISEERILRKLTTLSTSLKDDFLIRRPRIAVLALNPHAGDKGLIGTEEQNVIKPAIDKAVEQGILAFGPYSADGFFGAGQYTHFDAVLAMYHDQGLIPFKSLDMNGVNYTAGLPIIRTSPDHGTAYDLAGKGEANHLSFAHALYLAIDLIKNRATTEEINADPLFIKPREEKPERPHVPFFVPPKDEPTND